MTQEEYIDSKIKTMTDLSGKKSKALILKNETEIKDFKKQLALCNVSNSEVFKHYGKPFTSGRDLWDFISSHYNFTPKT